MLSVDALTDVEELFDLLYIPVDVVVLHVLLKK
jgi:hypothetical protein